MNSRNSIYVSGTLFPLNSTWQPSSKEQRLFVLITESGDEFRLIAPGHIEVVQDYIFNRVFVEARPIDKNNLYLEVERIEFLVGNIPEYQPA